MSHRTKILLLAVGMLFSACSGGTSATTADAGTTTTTTEPTTTTVATPDRLTIISHDSFASGVTEETFAAFTEQTGIEVRVLPSGDAGSMVNQAILTRDNPVADVLFGVDDTFLSRALDAELFIPYSSSFLASVPDSLELDPNVTPIDFGDVCLNYDKEAFVSVDPPESLDDLIDPTYGNLLVVESPATSSPGLAFLLATIVEYGEGGWQDYWSSLIENGVKIVPDWDTAYYGSFTRYGGSRSLVVSYASSPPAEVIFAEEPLEVAPTGVITAGCYRQIEFAGILAGTPYEEEAKLLIDYLLSVGFQEQIPLSWFVFPANEDAELPPEFIEHTVIPDDPARLDPATIDENRERWIEEWTELVLG